ncbi:hypothetical protein [Acaryochloris sp. IP29b_bin.137]|uniref:hypothetical protein n=1 Tax=Acaryochloris sp. IP29b_bin.137 TaxID=2969217 RepID=UPI002632386A|nr:hypothetical protein [Acaryochloris sp. IP29b_bin.137]
MIQTSRTILKRAGWSLILFGLLNISMMIYRGENGVNSMSNLLSLGVIAGVFLLRGNLKVTTWVTWFSAFYWMYRIFSTVIGIIVFQDQDLWMTQFRLYPILSSVSWIFTGALVIYLPWLYCQLRHQRILAALRTSGMEAAPPMSAWLGGAGLGIILSILIYLAFSSADAAEALQRAKQQLGPNYNYRMTSIGWSNSQVEAIVTVYNRNSIQSIDVEWAK